MTIDDRAKLGPGPGAIKASLGNTFHTKNMEDSELRVDDRWDAWIYEDHEEFALICAHQAHVTASDRVAAELWRIAKIHEANAAKLRSMKPVDIGEPPPWVQGQPSV
jgi:hypothetical protein